MSCDGFEHGTRVRVLKEVVQSGRVIAVGTVGTVEAVDREKHKIDVRFDEIGVIKSLPAHFFGFSEAVGLAH